MDLERRKAKAEEIGHVVRGVAEVAGVELRELSGDKLELTGMACVTEAAYDMGWYQETVGQNAFDKTLSENPDVQLLVNHEGLPVARTWSGNLDLTVRKPGGLAVRALVDKADPDVDRLAYKMRSQDGGRPLVDQMSFAFRCTEQDWNEDYDQRRITALSIHRGDVSVVNQGANPATSVALRSLTDLGVSISEYADAMAEFRAGASISAANMKILQRVLDYIAAADEAVDAAQPLLADLMGVPDPDADDAEPDADDASRGMSAIEKAAIAEKAHRLLADLAA